MPVCLERKTHVARSGSQSFFISSSNVVPSADSVLGIRSVGDGDSWLVEFARCLFWPMVGASGIDADRSNDRNAYKFQFIVQPNRFACANQDASLVVRRQVAQCDSYHLLFGCRDRSHRRSRFVWLEPGTIERRSRWFGSPDSRRRIVWIGSADFGVSIKTRK